MSAFPAAVKTRIRCSANSIPNRPLVASLSDEVWIHFIEENAGPFRGKFQWHRRMEEDTFSILPVGILQAKAPAIWADIPEVSPSEQEDSSTSIIADSSSD